MPMDNQEAIINEVINQLTITFGVGGFIAIVIVGLIIWFFFNQKVNRIEQIYTSELEKNRSTELDLLYRRRVVYSRLIKGMRVFLQKGDPGKK
jgi:ABC-type polysaccharide/polyol phosphate export permease